MSEAERRYFTSPVDDLDTRSLTDQGTFWGYLSVFGERDAYGDVVQPGAFEKTLEEKGRKRPLLWQHDPGSPIGMLSAREDDKGLFIEAELNLETQLGQETHSLLGQGAINGLSQGFEVEKAEESAQGEGRLLTELDLWEGSVVTFPALDSARVVTVKTRSDGRAYAENPEWERGVPCPRPFGGLQECIRDMRGHAGVEDPEAFCQAWDQACEERGIYGGETREAPSCSCKSKGGPEGKGEDVEESLVDLVTRRLEEDEPGDEGLDVLGDLVSARLS